VGYEKRTEETMIEQGFLNPVTGCVTVQNEADLAHTVELVKAGQCMQVWATEPYLAALEAAGIEAQELKETKR
jgi:hypothetical protein